MEREVIMVKRAQTEERRSERGMTLIEVLVVLAILLGLAVIIVPTLSSYLQLEQRRVAKELALSYEFLHDEAVLRNVTFRISYHLDEGFYQIEVGRPETLIFDNPEAREAYEEELDDRLKLLTEREIAEGEGKDDEATPFEQLELQFNTRVQMPRGTAIAAVYTPQYGELVGPSGDAESPAVVQSYIFANGFAEHTIIHLVDQGDPEEGYTIEVEPLSGRVHLRGELTGVDEMFSFVPEVPPELPT
jgi:prepilin-type N-terminal cleavage/methylation domain-containing protein